jgi:hypothetical protein
MHPTVLDPLALRVARRHLAVVRKVRSGRLAVEYQRRKHGLERVEPDETQLEHGDREVEDAGKERLEAVAGAG